jgi:hypothetical protein
MSRRAIYRYLAPHRQKKHEEWLAAGNEIPNLVDVIDSSNRINEELSKKLSKALAMKTDELFLKLTERIIYGESVDENLPPPGIKRQSDKSS